MAVKKRDAERKGLDERVRLRVPILPAGAYEGT
jgi:hypothetical protein